MIFQKQPTTEFRVPSLDGLCLAPGSPRSLAQALARSPASLSFLARLSASDLIIHHPNSLFLFVARDWLCRVLNI